MHQARRSWSAAAAIIAASLLLPLAGAALAGRNLAPIFRFPPPLAIPADFPRFSWIAVAIVLAPFAALAVAWPRHPRAVGVSVPAPHATGRFPGWGVPAVAWTVLWWALAWSRVSAFAAFQRYTFFPLWIGFIVVVNAAVVWRRGTCTLLRNPVRWAALFATSAVFWWVFEWLNRFTRNWHYLGVADFGAAAYAFNATLCFSTVLPAVTAVAELLDTSPGFAARCERGPALRWLATPAGGAVLLALGAAGLVGAGAWPWLFYAALWCAPLALALGSMVLSRSGDLPFAVARGNWRVAGTWAVAALICGFFWELWNVRSAAKWVYTVPYVNRWHVFEMPVLGYLGYLPFGLECYLVATRVLRVDSVDRRDAPDAPAEASMITRFPRALQGPAGRAPSR